MRAYLFMACLVSSSFAYAENNSWYDDILIHGFISQSFINTSDNQFFGNSEYGSFDFSELGINASYQLLPRVRLAAGLLSRQAGAFDNGSPRFDYALADIRLFSNQHVSSGIYLGRVKNEIGLYNSTRDVPQTRDGLFLPQVIYFDKVRNALISSDGLVIYNNIYFDNGTLLMQASTGYPLADKNVEYAYMGNDWQGNLQNDHLAFSGMLRYEQNGGQWIYSLTGSSFKIDFDAKGSDTIAAPIGPGFNSGTMKVDYTVLSLQYNAEKWQLTGEVAFENVNYNDIGGPLAEMDINSIGYYLQASYNINTRWQTFLRFEEFQLNKHDWDGEKAARNNIKVSQQLAGLGINRVPIPAQEYYSRSWVIGTRWLIDQRFMLRAEYHKVHGAATLSPRENEVSSTTPKWDMFALSLSYRF
ncbi:hypothetical protein LCGC14_1098520 [marine sediment metagenome]|uniref:Uncharacterized protein n=1 Tax=marine sediment metagenome TaxID=412755 RepID=A0A0F9MY42_9ZZZZ